MARIWFQETAKEALNALAAGTMMEHLGIEVTRVGDDFLEARMPVDQRTRQIYGILHGGASAALAETLGSLGAALCVDNGRYLCVGVEINANHIRSVRTGFVLGRASPIHLGRTTHVWEIRISDDATGKLVCVSRLTVAIREKGSEG